MVNHPVRELVRRLSSSFLSIRGAKGSRPKRRRSGQRLVRLERLESRQLLAADLLTQWATDTGPDSSAVRAVAASSDGHVYAGGHNRVSKWSGADGTLVWEREINATSTACQCVSINDIEIDVQGDVYIVGSLHGTVNFGTESVPFPVSSKGANDMYVAKLDPVAGDPLWVTTFSGTYDDYAYDMGNDLAVYSDATGAVTVYATGMIGNTSSSTTDVNTQAIAVKIHGSTGDVQWRQEWGEEGINSGKGVAVDANGNPHFTGNGAVTIDGVLLDTRGNYIVKMDPEANVEWAKMFEGLRHKGYYGSSESSDIAVDSTGGVFVVGTFSRGVDFDPGQGTYRIDSLNQTSDAYIAKLNADGSFAWAGAIHGDDNFDQARTVGIDSVGNVLVGGDFRSTADLDPSSGVTSVTSDGDGDAFVLQLSNSGDFLAAGRMGGVGVDLVSGLAIGPNDELYLGGAFTPAADLDPDPNKELTLTLDPAYNRPEGSRLGFLTRLGGPVAPNNAPTISSAGGPYTGIEDEPVTFIATASDLDGDPLTYTWSFGDGTTLTTTSDRVEHTYLWGSSSFNVTLTVSDGKGGSASTTTSARVTEVDDPTVANAGGPYSAVLGKAITFDASGSSDFDNQDGTTANDQTLSYNWNFGDGTTATGVLASRTYDSTGTFTVTLTVTTTTTDSLGVSTSTTTATTTTAEVTAAPVGSANDMYVWDLAYETQKRRNSIDYQFTVAVKSDSDANGLESETDAAVSGAYVVIELRKDGVVTRIEGTTDSYGIFRSGWLKNLSGSYVVEVISIMHANLVWNELDPWSNEDLDEDKDGMPELYLTI